MTLVWKPRTNKLQNLIQDEADRIGELTQPLAPTPSIDWGKFGDTQATTQTGIDWGKFQAPTQAIDWGKFAGAPTAKKVPWYEKPQEYYSRPAAANIMMPIWAQQHPEDPGSKLFAEHLAETRNDPLAYMKGFLPGGKAREAYDMAEMPKYARGAAEIGVELPLWLAMPGAGVLRGGSLAVKAAGLAKGASAAEIAAKLALPATGKAAKAARIARALLKPIAALETAPVKLIQRITKRRPISSLKVVGRLWDKAKTKDRAELLKLAGIEDVGGKAWRTLGREAQKEIMSALRLQPELLELAAKDKAVIPLLRKLTHWLEAGHKARKATDILVTKERGRRFGAAEKIVERELAKGKGYIEAYRASTKPLAGKLPAKLPELLEQLTKADIDKAIGIAHKLLPKYTDRLLAKKALMDVFIGSGKPPRNFELKLLEQVFGVDFVNTIRPLTRNMKAWNRFLDIANFPRALLTSFDVSATLRQNMLELFAHPRQLPGLMKRQLQAVVSQEKMIKFDKEFWARPGMLDIDNLLKSWGFRDGLREYMSALPGTPASFYQRAEPFQSHLVEKVWGVRHSSRAFVTATNDAFSFAIADFWKNTGMGKNASKIDVVDFVKLIGNSIGRGELGPFKKWGALLNATVFAPRYTASQWRMPRFLFSKSPIVRREAARRLARLMIFGINTLRLAQMAGAEVGGNPLSSDFGKIKIGKTRLDYWRGYSQISRFLSQLAMARRKSTSGKMYETTRKEVIERFFQSKASPGMGILYDLLVGKTYLGEEVLPKDRAKLLEQFRNRLAPLTIQDFVEALEEEGLGVAMAAGAAATFGVGVQTYGDLGAYEPTGIAQSRFGETGFGKTGFGQSQFGR